MTQDPQDPTSESKGLSLPLKLAIGTALGLGVVATGFVATKQGRRLVNETFRGVKRTPLEYDVLEALEEDRATRRLRIDVHHEGNGKVVLSGRVGSLAARTHALRVARNTPGVAEAVDDIHYDPDLARR